MITKAETNEIENKNNKILKSLLKKERQWTITTKKPWFFEKITKLQPDWSGGRKGRRYKSPIVGMMRGHH